MLYTGAPWKKLVMLLHPLFQAPITPSNKRHLAGENPDGYKAVLVVGAALEPSGFSPAQVSLGGSYRSMKNCVEQQTSCGALRKKLVMWLHPHFQAPTTPPERHQVVPGRPGSWGPPWNLLVSLRKGVSQRKF
jgi:hypothetical protein